MATTLKSVSEDIVIQILRDYGGASEHLRDLVVLGLNEEAGEVAGLRKRQLRQNHRDVDIDYPKEYIEELGDVLWYLTACCALCGTSLEEIWEYNQKKLEERYGHVDCATVGTII